MAICFFRLVYITVFEPPYVPLGPRALRERRQDRVESKSSSEGSGIGGAEYDPGNPSGVVAGSENDPDSPGLELFYTKDIFVCDMDGKPKCKSYFAFDFETLQQLNRSRALETCLGSSTARGGQKQRHVLVYISISNLN